MKGFSWIAGALGGAVLSAGVIAAPSSFAVACHNVYPPGWNQPATNLPQSTVVFRAGCGWDDYQQYWSDQTGCGSAKSHKMNYGPVIYQMNPQGERYHRVD
jgi:hypothetical protein